MDRRRHPSPFLGASAHTPIGKGKGKGTSHSHVPPPVAVGPPMFMGVQGMSPQAAPHGTHAPWGGAFPPTAAPPMRPMFMPVGMPLHHHPPPFARPMSPTESVACPVSEENGAAKAVAMPVPSPPAAPINAATINVGGVSYPAPQFTSPNFFKSPPENANLHQPHGLPAHTLPNLPMPTDPMLGSHQPPAQPSQPARKRSASASRGRAGNKPVPNLGARDEGESVMQLTSSDEDGLREAAWPSSSEMESPFPPAILAPPPQKKMVRRKKLADERLPAALTTWRKQRTGNSTPTSNSSRSNVQWREGGPSASLSSSPDDVPVKPKMFIRGLKELSTPHDIVDEARGVHDMIPNEMSNDPMLGRKNDTEASFSFLNARTDTTMKADESPAKSNSYLSRPRSVGPVARRKERVTQHLGTPARRYDLNLTGSNVQDLTGANIQDDHVDTRKSLPHPSAAVLSPPTITKPAEFTSTSQEQSSRSPSDQEGHRQLGAGIPFPETASTLRKMKEEAMRCSPSREKSENPLQEMVEDTRARQSLDFQSKIEKIILGELPQAGNANANANTDDDRSLTSFITADQSSPLDQPSCASSVQNQNTRPNRYADVLRPPSSSQEPDLHRDITRDRRRNHQHFQQNPISSSSNVPTQDPSSASTVAASTVASTALDSTRIQREKQENRKLRQQLQEKNLMIDALEAQMEIAPPGFESAHAKLLTPTSSVFTNSLVEEFTMDSVSHIGTGTRKPTASRMRSDATHNSRQLQKIQDERDMFRLENEKLRKQLMDQNHIELKHQRVVEELNHKIELAEDECTNLRQNVNSNSSKGAHLEIVKRDLQKLQATIDEKDSQLEEFSNKYTTARTRRKALELENRELLANLERSRNTISDIEQQCKDDASARDELQTRYEKLESDLKEYESREKQYEAELQEARAVNLDQRENIADIRNKHDEVLRGYQAEFDEFRKHLQEAQSQISREQSFSNDDMHELVNSIFQQLLLRFPT